MSQRGRFEPLLLLALFYQSTPSCFKVIGGVVGWWGGGGPCDFSVSPSPFGLDFWTLDFWTSDSGLTIIMVTHLLVMTSPRELVRVAHHGVDDRA